MHHAHAAPTHAFCVFDEVNQCLTRFFASQSVQVNLALNAPAAFSQLAGHVSAYARSAVAQRVVCIQQRFHIKLIRQSFLHHGQLVQLMLYGNGCRCDTRQTGAVAGAMLGWQRFDDANGQCKEVFFCFGLGGRRFFGCFQLFGSMRTRLQLGFNGFQTLQIFDGYGFHDLNQAHLSH